MLKSLLFATLCLAALPRVHAAGTLTDTELKWLNAGAPVLAYARELKLPVDIIVQPKAGPNDVPIAMGFDGGRCKLVFSMRGNAQPDTLLEKLNPRDHGVIIEAITAHEIAHCWRYAQGVWHTVPAAFAASSREKASTEDHLATHTDAKQIRATQREEGFSDLVALAWIKRRYPEHYDMVFAWLNGARSEHTQPHSAHDTRTWVKLARSEASIDQGATPFDDVQALWNAGLQKEK